LEKKEGDLLKTSSTEEISTFYHPISLEKERKGLIYNLNRLLQKGGREEF